MENQIYQIAERLKGMRSLLDISLEEMAEVAGVSVEDYKACEEGQSDFSFTFLFKCAQRFGIDLSELLTGDGPKLSFYTVVRKNEGMPIKRRHGFDYQHLAYLMKNRISEPFVVEAKYHEEEQNAPIALSTHEGQEFDYILEGSLKVQLEGYTELLREGDSIYYDSGHPHGMIAVDGKPCKFLAIVMKKEREEN